MLSYCSQVPDACCGSDLTRPPKEKGGLAPCYARH